FHFGRCFLIFALIAMILPGRLFGRFFFVFVVVFVVFVFTRRRGGVVAVEAGEFWEAGRFGEFRAVAGNRGFHVGAPDRTRRGTAVAGRFTGLRVTHPDRGRVERCVADEPGVGEVLRGTGLARRRRAAHRGVSGAGALRDHALQHSRHFVRLALAQHPLAVV